MDIEKIIERIVENGRIEDMEILSDILEDTMEEVAKYDKECFDKYLMKLYQMAYGNILNKEMAHEIVLNMKPYAERWSLEDTQKMQQDYGIDNIRPVDFYIVINSAYNDYKDLFNDEIEKYIKFTVDFIQDEDAKSDKVFLYYTTIPQ